ncbi:hypothetical protein EPN81_03590 [Patescibacteria group bacterium]|nr:MAG: hypothetical protein EPN81_03590 [Patescibacteria group bacterium]
MKLAFSSKIIWAMLASVIALGMLIGGWFVFPFFRDMQDQAEIYQTQETGVLLFEIGMHIEPHGAEVSDLVSQQGASAESQNIPAGRSTGPDYNNETFFQKSVDDIEELLALVERHNGVVTIQAQSPFTTTAIKSDETAGILGEWEKRGHEIGLHFHEDAHLGKNSEALPIQTWCDVFGEEIDWIRALGASDVRYWSGGNLYPDVYEAAVCAGLGIHGDWKNPEKQDSHAEFLGLHPWRPSGGTDGEDIESVVIHNPERDVVYLPSGIFSRTDYAATRRSEEMGGDEGYFEFLEESLRTSVESVDPDRINVFHITIHPGEFKGGANEPFQVIEDFLTEVVDPLVAEGKVRWATFSGMADAFTTWEKANPTIDPRGGEGTSATKADDSVMQEEEVSTDSSLGEAGDEAGTYWVTNPSDGDARLFVQVIQSDENRGKRLPTLVLFPSGGAHSSLFTQLQRKKGSEPIADTFAQAGFTVVVFDPDGRGQSEGTDDLYGFVHQDGVKEIVKYIQTLPEVDSEQIGFVSYSYGNNLASATMARYPELPIRFFIDWEGPAGMEQFGCTDGASVAIGFFDRHPCSDQDYWDQHTPLLFIPKLTVPYLRVQTEVNHVAGNGTKHALELVNAAIDGGVPWVRLNDGVVNQLYDLNSPPSYISEQEEKNLTDKLAGFATELFTLVD